MGKRILLSSAILFLFFYSCTKVKNSFVEAKDKIINAYWSDINDLTIKVDDDEAYVVDFGNSNLGSNPNVFNRTIPFIKNITRINIDSWNGEIIKPSFDPQGKLNDFTYEKTKITFSTSSSGNEILIFSDDDNNLITWNKKPVNYVPPTPVDPNVNQPITCDSISHLTYNNFVSLLDVAFEGHKEEFKDYKVRSSLYMPDIHSKETDCHYKMEGDYYNSGRKITILFSHKPSVNQDFKIVAYHDGLSGWSPLTKNTAVVYYERSHQSIDNGSFVNVSVNGSEITATLNNVLLENRTYVSRKCMLSCVLKD